MSDERQQQLRLQLTEVAFEAKQAAGNLASFSKRFAEHSAQVQDLVGGTATGVDRGIVQVLDAASWSVEQAAEALESAAVTCRRYAERI